MARPRIGIWMIGARGGVAAATLVGLAALKKGLAGDAGLVSRLPCFAQRDLADWGQFVAAGHEIRDVGLLDEAIRLASESRAIDPALVDRCRRELDQIDGRVCPGTVVGVGPAIAKLADGTIPRRESPRAALERVQADLRAFVKASRLDHLIVVNVASTEPPVEADQMPATWGELEKLLDRPRKCPLPASSLYAVAALEMGASYINFTPSLGSAPDAIDELARLRQSRHMGCDGKTGETLMKSVLAPMFAHRNLEVMSWVGHNIFGNMDGQILDDPVNKQSKLTSKSRLLGEILGYRPKSLVSIEYVEDLGDWKTAWDHVHFRGFLGAPMTLQFIWHACDSLLAAPLVLDLVRFTELAWRRGEIGRMTFLASFFKSPDGVREQGFVRQFQMLEAWAKQGAVDDGC